MTTSGNPWLAHSARPKRNIPVQSYSAHIRSVLHRAVSALEAMLRFYRGPEEQLCERMRTALSWSTVFHDLGKLQGDNQAILRGLTGEKLAYPHEGAGALHCLQHGQRAAALAIHSHHQGLTDASGEWVQFKAQLDGEPYCPFVREGQYAKAAELLPQLLTCHAEAIGAPEPVLPMSPVKVLRWHRAGRVTPKSDLTALEMRLLLSMLADADQGDTAHHYGQEPKLSISQPRWEERIRKLEQWVAGLGKDEQGNARPSARDSLRRAVYKDCCYCDLTVPIYACDAPVGSGKTTAVMAYLLRVARQHKLRRIFVVLPFTNIIHQSVEVYRKALVLEGEDPEHIVAEHHHVAEFQSPEARGLTTLWQAPIVVTTAVQFFETLAGRAAPRLRKLHALPGSAIFIDEAHAAMPLHLWPSMWDRLVELSTNWSCHYVLGSGSLPRFWENSRIFSRKTEAPAVMLQQETIELGVQGEQQRVCFRTKTEPQTLSSLVQWLQELQGARLVVMNTLQSAGALARELAGKGTRTLHLSTALTPAHREGVLAEAEYLLSAEGRRSGAFVMVATSCIEAGMDLSFDTALRERSSVSSLIQIGGRVNRDGSRVKAEVWDFVADNYESAFTANPALSESAKVVEQAFARNVLHQQASDVMTDAIAEEFKRNPKDKLIAEIQDAETAWEFATVAAASRIILDDNVTAVVDPDLVARLSARQAVRHTELVRGSVSIRRNVVARAALEKLEALHDDNLYIWPRDQYDYDLLGTMKYLLTLKDISNQNLIMI